MLSHSLSGLGRALCLGIWLLGIPQVARAADPAPPVPLSPADAVHAALLIHPLVRQADASLQAAQGARSQAGSLRQNPQLSGSLSVDGTRAGAALSQPISATGEGLHARVATQGAVDAADSAQQRAHLVAASQVRTAYIAAVVATGRVRVASAGVELAERLLHAVTRQHEEGQASTLSLRLARLAEVQAATRLMDARQSEVTALRQLAAMVGRPVGAADLSADPLAAVPDPLSVGGPERSDVVAARSALGAASAELDRQRAATMPPVGVGVFVEREDQQTFVGPSLSVTVPVFNRNQSGRATAQGKEKVAKARLRSIDAQATTERLTASQRLAEAETLVSSLAADPEQEATAALTSIEAGYLAGELDLPTTILLQNDVLDGQNAAMVLRGQLGLARLDNMLAIEDPALLAARR